MCFNNFYHFNKNFVSFKNKSKRRKRKRRRGKHLYSLFLSRSKKYSLYYQPFDSKLVDKNRGASISALVSNSNKAKFNIGLKSTKLELIRIISLKGLKFCSQKFLKSLYIEKYFRFNISIFPDYWLTSKPKSVRMGKGKGAQKFKVYFLNKGQDIFNFRYIFNLRKFISDKKLYIFKFNVFVWFLMKILKGKPAVKNVTYKKLF